MKWLAMLVALLVLAPLARASTGDGVSSVVTPQKVKLGEPFVWRVAVTRPTAQRFDLAPPSLPPDFALLGFDRRREDHGSEATTTFEMRLALYKLGKQSLPALALSASGTPPPAVAGPEVEGLSTVLPNARKLLDIEPPSLFSIRSFAIVGGAALALLLIGAGGVLAWKRPWRRKLRLDRRVHAALDQLARERLPQQGRAQELFFRVDHELRRYFAERYRFDAMECTGFELVTRLRRLDAPGLPLEPTEHFVARAELVKFAKHPVDESACDEALAFGHRLVDATFAPPTVKEGADARVRVS